MLDKVISNELFNSLPQDFQILIIDLLSLSNQGLKLENSAYTAETYSNPFVEDKDKVYAKFNIPIDNILTISIDDFIYSLQFINISKYKKELSLIIREAIETRFYKPDDDVRLEYIKLKEYIYLANELLKSKNESHEWITNLNELTLKLSKSTNKLELVLYDKIIDYQAREENILKGMLDYCNDEMSILAFINYLCDLKAFSIQGAAIYAITNTVSLALKCDYKLEFYDNKVSLLVDIRNYDVESIWRLISNEKNCDLMLEKLKKYSEHSFNSKKKSNENTTSALVSIEPMQTTIDGFKDGAFSRVPVDIIYHILSYLLPKKNQLDKRASFKNLINIANLNKNFNRLIKIYPYWEKLTVELLRNKYGYKLNLNSNDLQVTSKAVTSKSRVKSNKKTPLKMTGLPNSQFSSLDTFIKTRSAIVTTMYDKFIQEITREKITVGNIKELNAMVATDPFLYLDCAIKITKDGHIRTLANKHLLKCVEYIYKAIELNNHAGWFVLYMIIAHDNVFSKVADEISRLFNIDNDLSAIKSFVLNKCVESLCDSSSDQSLVRKEFLRYISRDQNTGYVDFFEFNFQKLKKVFNLLLSYKIADINKNMLLALYDCGSPEDVVKNFSAQEFNYLANSQLAKNLFKLISNDDSLFTPIQIDRIVNFIRTLINFGQPYFNQFKAFELFNFNLLAQIIISPVGEIFTKKFDVIILSQLFGVIYPCKDSGKIFDKFILNPNHQKILDALSDPYIMELIKNNANLLLLETLFYSINFHPNTFSIIKFKACNLSILFPTIKFLIDNTYINKAMFDDIISVALNEEFFNRLTRDVRLVYSCQLPVLRRIYKSEPTVEIFMKHFMKVRLIDTDSLLLILEKPNLVNERCINLLSILSGFTKLNTAFNLILERLEVINRFEDELVFDFYCKNPSLFINPMLKLTDFEKINSNFIFMIEQLNENLKNKILESNNFLALIFNFKILSIICFNTMTCDHDVFLSILRACRSFNYKILNAWQEIDIVNLLAKPDSIIKKMNALFMRSPEILMYARSVEELESLCNSSLLNRIVDSRNNQALIKLGYSELFNALNYSLANYFAIFIHDGNYSSKRLADAILELGNNKLWLIILRLSSNSLANVVDLINNNPLINSLLGMSRLFLNSLFNKLSFSEVEQLSRNTSISVKASDLNYFSNLGEAELNIIFSSGLYTSNEILYFTSDEIRWVKFIASFPFKAIEKLKKESEKYSSLKKLFFNRPGISWSLVDVLNSQFLMSLLPAFHDKESIDCMIELVNKSILPILLRFKNVSYPLTIKNHLKAKLEKLEEINKIPFDEKTSLLTWMSTLSNQYFLSFLLSMEISAFKKPEFIQVITACDYDHPIFQKFSPEFLWASFTVIINPWKKTFFEILTLPGTKKEFENWLLRYPFVVNQSNLYNLLMNDKVKLCKSIIASNKEYRSATKITTFKLRKKRGFIDELTEESLKKESKRTKPSSMEDDQSSLMNLNVNKN